jgi:hypothetical protein
MDKELKKKIRKLKKEKKWDELIVLLKVSLKAKIENPEQIQNELKKAQIKYVDEKMHSPIIKDLKGKKDLKSLFQIYHTLLAILPESKRIRKELQELRLQRSKEEIQKEKLYIKESKAKIEKLIQDKQYDSAIQASYEFLTQEIESQSFKTLLQKALKEREKGINEDLEKYFTKSDSLIESEYKQDSEKFIKI